MNMTVWNPLREMEELLDRYTRVRSPVAADETTGSLTEWSPSVDIEENDDSYLIKADLPGVKKDDIEVTVENGVLRISGEKRIEKETGKGTRQHRTERYHGSFARYFTLPRAVEADKVKARFEDGVLSLTIPKSEEARPKTIEVQVH